MSKPVNDCYSMDLFACGFGTRDFVPHGSCATHHASPLACVLRRTAYRQKFPISFALRACFLDFCRNTASPRRRISSHGITQSFPKVCDAFPWLHNFRTFRLHWSFPLFSIHAIPFAILLSLSAKWLPGFHSRHEDAHEVFKISYISLMASPTVAITGFFVFSSLSPRLRYTAGL